MYCLPCGRLFAEQSHLEQHFTDSLFHNPYRMCPTCNKMPQSPVTYHQHRSVCRGKGSVLTGFVCKSCFVVFPSADLLQGHFRAERHRLSLARPEPAVCSECGRPCTASIDWTKSIGCRSDDGKEGEEVGVEKRGEKVCEGEDEREEGEEEEEEEGDEEGGEGKKSEEGLRCLAKVGAGRDMQDHIAASCDGIPACEKLACKSCNATLDTSASLNRHLASTSVHPSRLSHWCTVCQFVLGSDKTSRVKKRRFVPNGPALLRSKGANRFTPISNKRSGSGGE